VDLLERDVAFLGGMEVGVSDARANTVSQMYFHTMCWSQVSIHCRPRREERVERAIMDV
jgi:uncharacterized membrane protein